MINSADARASEKQWEVGFSFPRFGCLGFYFLIFALSAVSAVGSEEQETPHLEFVTEYIRELAAIQHIRESFDHVKPHTQIEQFSNSIYSFTRLQIELKSQIQMLHHMRLNHPYEELIPKLGELYELEIGLYQKIIEICKTFIAGPPKGVDYGKLASEMPRLRADLDNLDETIFKNFTPLVFVTLINQRADSKNHLSHLVITRAEKAALIRELTTQFSTIDKKGQNYTVSAARVLKQLLMNGHLCSDDPW